MILVLYTVQNTHQTTLNADLIKLIPPNSSKVALECDHVVLNCDLNADQGHFVFHYANKLGSCSVLQAELWGI
jgi:hypothetical protein